MEKNIQKGLLQNEILQQALFSVSAYLIFFVIYNKNEDIKSSRNLLKSPLPLFYRFPIALIIPAVPAK